MWLRVDCHSQRCSKVRMFVAWEMCDIIKCWDGALGGRDNNLMSNSIGIYTEPSIKV